jgi:sensor histidine kinase YesM
MSTAQQERRILGIKWRELGIFLLFYYLFATFYHVTLWINRGTWDKDRGPLFDWVEYFDSVGLDYIIKLALTYPIWWLLFRRLRDRSNKEKITLHIVFLPLFVIIWQQLFYLGSEAFGFGHLQGAASAWDIYIPSLFYVLQFGILHSYNYYLDNQRKVQLEGELRNAALKSELSALKAQLNPHFLYNVFNTISASVPAKNEKTRRMIAELSDLFRYQLKASQVEKVALHEELDFVNKYLELEKERFQERLNIEIDVDYDIMNEMIPPMLLQPLVENSIKHGLSSLIEGGKIILKIKKRTNGKLIFEISDTGVGVVDKEAVFDKGIGLTNTKLRLEKLYQTTLQLSDNTPRGLKISFEI